MGPTDKRVFSIVTGSGHHSLGASHYQAKKKKSILALTDSLTD